MEQNMPIIAKKLCNTIRLLYFMLRKGIIDIISKSKLFSDLNSLIKRGKLAGKAAIHNLIFHSAATAVRSPAPEMVAASPWLPGFGPSPVVRQLRITDSPFPLREIEEEGDRVDEAAEEFIVRFYKDLKKQNAMVYLGYS